MKQAFVDALHGMFYRMVGTHNGARLEICSGNLVWAMGNSDERKRIDHVPVKTCKLPHPQGGKKFHPQQGWCKDHLEGKPCRFMEKCNLNHFEELLLRKAVPV